LTLLFRASRDGFDNGKFHLLCDGQGPLLVIIKTQKDILIGGVCSISWKNIGEFPIDPKCVVFSISRQRIYNRLNDNNNLYFNSERGPVFGNACISTNNKKLRGYSGNDPFKIPKNGEGE
jgi:hypothetical protein